jgi:long-chain fatty acid transport protein
LARASIALGVLLLLARPALGTPSALFSLGPESQALGKTGVAGVGDFGATLLNPAALAVGPERALWLGYGAARFAPKLEGFAGPTPSEPSFESGVLGLKFPIAPRWVPPGLTLVLVLTSPRDVIVRAKLPLPETPQFPLLSARAHALDLGLSLGARLSRHFYAGIGLRGLAGLEGEVLVAAEGERGGVEDELSLNLAPVAGILFAPNPNDALGLVYRGALSAPFEVELNDQGLVGITLPPLHLDGLAHYDHAEIGVEWAHAFGATRVALGVVFERWSAFEGWLGRTVSCPPEQPECAALPKEQVELEDTLSPRLGASHRVELGPADITLRAGYAFEPSPLPEQTGAANRWDNARSLFTIGYGVSLPDTPLGFGAVYQLHWLHRRSHEKTEPISDPVFSRVTVAGTVQYVGLTTELRY